MRYEAESQPAEPIPRKPVALTATQEGMAPGAADLTAEAFEALQVSWDSVVVVVPLHHASQPAADGGNGLMPPAR